MQTLLANRHIRRHVSRWLVALASIALGLPALAQEAIDPVQLQLEAALDQAMSTTDQLDAVAAAQQAWDEQLNRLYRQLQQQLPEESALALRESQRAWLRFRDAEHAALQAYYAGIDGSLHRVTHAMDRSRLLQHRVTELEAWTALLRSGDG